MKRYRMKLKERNSNRTNCIYVEANSYEEAVKDYENNYNRFNELIYVKEVKVK